MSERIAKLAGPLPDLRRKIERSECCQILAQIVILLLAFCTPQNLHDDNRCSCCPVGHDKRNQALPITDIRTTEKMYPDGGVYQNEITCHRRGTPPDLHRSLKPHPRNTCRQDAPTAFF